MWTWRSWCGLSVCPPSPPLSRSSGCTSPRVHAARPRPTSQWPRTSGSRLPSRRAAHSVARADRPAIPRLLRRARVEVDAVVVGVVVVVVVRDRDADLVLLGGDGCAGRGQGGAGGAGDEACEAGGEDDAALHAQFFLSLGWQCVAGVVGSWVQSTGRSCKEMPTCFTGVLT